MGKIVAIGGGEIGRPGYPIETTSIDREIIELTGKSHPKVLFIPTASLDSEGYYETVKSHFGSRLGCNVDVLYLVKENPTKQEIERKLFSSDIVYVGGGNTLRMMNVWKSYGLDILLRKAHSQGIVLSGLSAGAICWFRYGNSDSRKFTKSNARLIKVSGLNLVNALFCPHYDVEKDRKAELKAMMMKTPGISIALENCSALEIVDSMYRVISSKETANAYKVYWKQGKFHHELLPKKEFLPLEELLRK